jgi:hypothetical protein
MLSYTRSICLGCTMPRDSIKTARVAGFSIPSLQSPARAGCAAMGSANIGTIREPS